jgi:ethanolamine ammonia-lyase small subunit
MDEEHNLAAPSDWPELLNKIRSRTPARIFVPRGASYSTQMHLDLRAAHAGAIDAVWAEFDLQKDLPGDWVDQERVFQVASRAESKSQFLLRPDLGRALSDDAKLSIVQRCPKQPDVQVVIGDGLSVAAVSAQVPALLPLLREQFSARGWSLGQPFAVRYCRVGIMNAIGDLLDPRVLILLIGERPGLATAESLSAYMAYAPKSGHTDADRNLISNIHARGVPIAEASARITNLVAQMFTLQCSGTTLKEEAPELLE